VLRIARPGEWRLDPDGDRRADLDGDAGARPLRQRRAAPGVPGPSISGDYVACLGVSETGAGSDVASIKTNDARRVGGDWVINGGKMWTTNGAQADWMCLLANTGDGQATRTSR
jgi:Acyl-CoA dehydrogenases